MGRGYPVAYSETDFVKLTIFRDNSGRARWVRALRSTADYYGWLDEFEVWTPNINGSSGSYPTHAWPHRQTRGSAQGGRSCMICRKAPVTDMHAGTRNRFVMANACRLVDFAELAHFSKGEWHWMSGPTGERVSRDRWESMYQTGTQGRRRGLVSV